MVACHLIQDRLFSFLWVSGELDGGDAAEPTPPNITEAVRCFSRRSVQHQNVVVGSNGGRGADLAATPVAAGAVSGPLSP